MEWQSLGRMLIGVGALLFLLGVILVGLGKFLHIGSLPGDIVYKKGNFTFYFPIVTCIIISIIISLILRIFQR
ncbi:MAG: DUF2905 domain-containing protein [Bacillota bacterium]|jgi:hypothetical protein|nr:DUF2905 domain-containing protein [Clostridia bacterium]